MPPVTTSTQVQVTVLDTGATEVRVEDETHIQLELHEDRVQVATACERGVPGTARIRNEPHTIDTDGAHDWELVHLNGVLLRRGDDYTITGAVVALVEEWQLIAGDRIDVVYPF